MWLCINRLNQHSHLGRAGRKRADARSCDPQRMVRTGLDVLDMRGAMGIHQCATKKNWYFHIFRLRLAVYAQWSGREWNISTVLGSDGCTISITVLPKKKKKIMSKGVNCIVLSGLPSPTGPTPASRRNLQNLRATSQIYCKFCAPPTLHHFTCKNQHFTPGSLPSWAFICT